jgi:hypothetical protein
MLHRSTKLACNIMDNRRHKQHYILVTMSYLRIWWSWLWTCCTSCTDHSHPSPARNPCCSPSDLQQHNDTYYTTSKRYNTIISTKFTSFSMATFSASITNRPPQSHDCNCCLNIRILASTPPTAETHWYIRIRLHAIFTCDISLGWLKLLASKAGDFVELILI